MPNAADKPPAVPPAAMPEVKPEVPPETVFALRVIRPATAEERLTREEGMARALKFGAAPYRDAGDQGRYVLFKEANLVPVEPWRRDPRNKRRYRRVQEVRKAAGQLIGQPGDRIEIAKRLGVLHYEDGSDIEGAAARGLHDAIWSRDHIYDTFDVPRRTGRSLMETGRIAAVAEDEARKLQAEDPQARGGFWVRMRNDLGLVYVVPNADPEAEGGAEEITGGGSEDVLVGQADAAVVAKPAEAQADPGKTEDADATPAGEPDATDANETPANLNYPAIPLPALEPTWVTPKGQDTPPPVINMEKDRIKNILANEPATFEIKDWPNASSQEPVYASHLDGYLAVLVYEPVIDHVCALYDVDPSLVKALMYVENAHGGFYGRLAEWGGRAKTILPMNINPKIWGALVGPDADFSDPLTNVMAGVIMARRIWERIPKPTVAKVASNYLFTGREKVSDYGARVAEVYETRLWQQVPSRFTPSELKKMPTTRAYLDAQMKRRKEFEKRFPSQE